MKTNQLELNGFEVWSPTTAGRKPLEEVKPPLPKGSSR